MSKALLRLEAYREIGTAPSSRRDRHRTKPEARGEIGSQPSPLYKSSACLSFNSLRAKSLSQQFGLGNPHISQVIVGEVSNAAVAFT